MLPRGHCFSRKVRPKGADPYLEKKKLVPSTTTHRCSIFLLSIQQCTFTDQLATRYCLCLSLIFAHSTGSRNLPELEGRRSAKLASRSRVRWDQLNTNSLIPSPDLHLFVVLMCDSKQQAATLTFTKTHTKKTANTVCFLSQFLVSKQR